MQPGVLEGVAEGQSLSVWLIFAFVMQLMQLLLTLGTRAKTYGKRGAILPFTALILFPARKETDS